ncbi:MAG: MGMT family protein [Lachnospiraceae bacterium]|nr:MGMT family protein [Lachnospiraceae bacterium]
MDFYKRVELVCSRIPNGTVASYGQIALLCGMPKHARQVGFALNRNLAGEQAPAHRVVNARGVLSGAASFETYEMQKLFLEKEGVTVAKGRKGWQVDLKKYGWKPDMKEAVWLREEFLRRGI